MKKLFIFALVLALLAVPLAHAEDYASMTDEQLWEANKAIQAELWARSITKDGVTIPQGEYIIGEDIPEGVYRIAVPEGGWSATLKMSTESGEEKRFAVSDDGPIGKLDLTGYKYISFSSAVIFYAYTGLFN